MVSEIGSPLALKVTGDFDVLHSFTTPSPKRLYHHAEEQGKFQQTSIGMGSYSFLSSPTSRAWPWVVASP